MDKDECFSQWVQPLLHSGKSVLIVDAAGRSLIAGQLVASRSPHGDLPYGEVLVKLPAGDAYVGEVFRYVYRHRELPAGWYRVCGSSTDSNVEPASSDWSDRQPPYRLIPLGNGLSV